MLRCFAFFFVADRLVVEFVIRLGRLTVYTAFGGLIDGQGFGVISAILLGDTFRLLAANC